MKQLIKTIELPQLACAAFFAAPAILIAAQSDVSAGDLQIKAVCIILAVASFIYALLLHYQRLNKQHRVYMFAFIAIIAALSGAAYAAADGSAVSVVLAVIQAASALAVARCMRQVK